MLLLDLQSINFILQPPVLLVNEISLSEIEDKFIPGVVDPEERAKIHIPREVLERSDQDPVRMASLLFRNMSGLLPERLKGNDNNRLV